MECVTQTTHYSQDRFNVPLYEETSDGKVSRYSYLPGTNLLAAKLVGTASEIFEREFRSYNSDNLLVEVIHDDGCSSDRNDLTGVTSRKYSTVIPRMQSPAVGFPDSVTRRLYPLRYRAKNTTKAYRVLL